MSTAKVSVIIPVYNVEKYVNDSVSSILHQSLTDIEVIIINDGSTDSSLSIIENLASNDSRIKIINTPNNGLSVARNLGLYHAVGEYVYFFDSDDLLERTALEKCYIKSIKENLDFCFFDADTFSDEGQACEKFNYNRSYNLNNNTFNGADVLKIQLQKGAYRCSACLSFIKNRFLKENNLFFYPHTIHEDELFTFLIYLCAHKVGFINEVLFHRRVRNDSIMTKPFSNRNAEGILTVCRQLKLKSSEYFLPKDSIHLCYDRINMLFETMFSSMVNDNILMNKYRNNILSEFREVLYIKLFIKLKFYKFLKYYYKIRN